MSKLFLKQISVISAILGAGLGILSLIPLIRNLSIFALVIIIAPVVIIFMKKNNLLKEVNIREGMIIGAISGIVSVIAFIIVFTPIDLFLSLFIKNGYINWIASLIKTAGFFVYIMLLFFMCILNAITNAFSGLTTAYVYEFLKNMKE